MAPPELFGPYPILRKISQGEFSQIFAIQKEDRILALKKLKPYLKYDYEYTALIDNEAALLSLIQDPAHFPRLFEHGEIQKEHYLILELLEGIDLGKVVRQNERGDPIVPLEIAGKIVLEMAQGLERLHDTPWQDGKPCVHADLRPSNVMATVHGEVKLIDLGLKGGTFIYMPLSRMHSRQIDPYTDIYALGHIFYELTHGKILLEGMDKLGTYFEMREKKIRPELFSSRLPLSIREWLSEILQQEKEPKYLTIPPLLQDLETILTREKLLASSEELGRWVRDYQAKNSS